FQAEDGIRERNVTGVQTCALPISVPRPWCARLPVLVLRARLDPVPRRGAGRVHPWKSAAGRLAAAQLRAGQEPPKGQKTYGLSQIGRAACRERRKTSVMEVEILA